MAPWMTALSIAPCSSSGKAGTISFNSTKALNVKVRNIVTETTIIFFI
jgi:hypothetical protein